MTYKKIKTTKIESELEEAYAADCDTIVGKILVFNPSGSDVNVEVYFVDKTITDEYDTDTEAIVAENTQGFSTTIPSGDTDVFGEGLTFSANQSVYIECDGSVIVHIFGKLVN